MRISIPGYASVLEDKTRKLVEPRAEVCIRDTLKLPEHAMDVLSQQGSSPQSGRR